MTNCCNCTEEAEHSLSGIESLAGLCENCWTERYHNGAEDRLLDAGVLTPRAVAELEAHFYDTTDPSDTAAFTEHMTALLDEVPRVTPLRLGTAEDLAIHAGVATTGGTRDFYDAVQWPGADPQSTLYTVAFFAPICTPLPLWTGAFIAGTSPTDIDDRAVTVCREWGRLDEDDQCQTGGL